MRRHDCRYREIFRNICFEGLFFTLTLCIYCQKKMYMFMFIKKKIDLKTLVTPRKFQIICIILILFVWSLSSHSRTFHSYGDITIAGEGLQIVTYARHSWPLSSEGSLTCHTHWETGLPFIMVNPEDPWHSHLLPSGWQWSCHYLFLRLRSVVTGNKIQISRMHANALPVRHRGG